MYAGASGHPGWRAGPLASFPAPSTQVGGVRVARASRQKDSGGGMLFNATRGTRAPLKRRNSPSEPLLPPGSLESGLAAREPPRRDAWTQLFCFPDSEKSGTRTHKEAQG